MFEILAEEFDLYSSRGSEYWRCNQNSPNLFTQRTLLNNSTIDKFLLGDEGLDSNFDFNNFRIGSSSYDKEFGTAVHNLLYEMSDHHRDPSNFLVADTYLSVASVFFIKDFRKLNTTVVGNYIDFYP